MSRGLDLYSKEAELINQAKRELENGRRKEPLHKLRLLCYSHGSTGFLVLGRALRAIDEDGTKNLNIDEFTSGFRKAEINCTDFEVKQIFDRLDPEKTGSVKVGDFLELLRPEMPQQRSLIIDKAFSKIDKANASAVTLKDIKANYVVKDDPKYQSGQQTAEEIMTAFLENFSKGNTDVNKSRVTKEDFMNYYAIVSASIDHDAYFDLLMRKAYKL